MNEPRSAWKKLSYRHGVRRKSRSERYTVNDLPSYVRPVTAVIVSVHWIPDSLGRNANTEIEPAIVIYIPEHHLIDSLASASIRAEADSFWIDFRDVVIITTEYRGIKRFFTIEV